jgi:hypothetical protein
MKTKEQAFQPIIIIGAGRSGTNMLRDALTQLPGFGTWPCDEINYIWRHGNTRFPTDEFDPQQATPAVKAYIQRTFARFAKNNKLSYVVEKTCANSLRVGFVDAILPNAKYLFIVRDGRDVVASALKRWSAPIELHYILKKARFIPPGDIPYYGTRYLGNRVYRLLSREKRLAFWGPRFEGMQELLQAHSLPEVCAHQWRRCVERSASNFRTIPAQRVYQLRYEDLVREPDAEFQKILSFLEVKGGKEGKNQFGQLGKAISATSVGKWQTDLSATTLATITPIMQPLLAAYGYDSASVSPVTSSTVGRLVPLDVVRNQREPDRAATVS